MGFSIKPLTRMALMGLGLAGSFALATMEAEASKFVSDYNMPDLKWKTIETEHFNVHYPVSRRSKEQGNRHALDGEWAARKMAKVSEEMWESMCQEFDYPMVEKINIVLIEQFDALQGFTIPSWDWVEISANPGSYFYRMRGRMEWFSDVLVHEFAHVVSLKRNSALSEGTMGVLVGGLYSDGINNQDSGLEMILGDTDPFWWTEGGAEYWSDQTGYNWWTASRDMNLRTTVLEDRLLTYDEWSTRMQSFDWGDGERGYQQGYSIALYLRQRFGETTFTEFANVSDKRLRLKWETVIEEVTGVKAEQLYEDWKQFLETHYQAVYDEVLEEGEVEGRELELQRQPFEFRSAADRDKFYTDKKQRLRKKLKRRKHYEGERHKTGTWDLMPRYSPDGKWLAEHVRGSIQVVALPETMLPSETGDNSVSATRAEDMRRLADLSMKYPAAFMHGYDFVNGQDKLVVTAYESTLDSMAKPKFKPHVEVDGYDWKQLAIVDLKTTTKTRRHNGGLEEYQSLDFHKTKKNGKPSALAEMFKNQWKGVYTPIPNTARGSDPTVSPNGERVAYFEYGDGTLNLVAINLDGTEKKYLTDFDDGTWLQGGDWSPDGTQIAFSIFRNYRQDMYIVNADGTGLKAINKDEWEDQDVYWGQDGMIYFSSEPTKIFNIFRYNPKTSKIHQLTNVIGGAQTPSLTPSGDLMYTQFTAHGWKNFVVSKDEFLEKDVTELFNLNVDAEDTKQELAYREDLSEFEAVTKPYKPIKNMMSPMAVPMFRFENDNQTNWGLSAGVELFAQDFVEYHTLFGRFMIGNSPFVMAGYTFHGWHPDIMLLAYRFEGKSVFGYLLDDDQDLDTTDDQGIYEVKQNQASNVVMARMDYVMNPNVDWYLFGMGREVSFRSGANRKFEPFLRGLNLGTGFQYHNRNVAYARSSANPRGYRVIEGTYSHGYTDMVYRPQKGRDTDDGEILDAYHFNQVEFRYTDHLPVKLFKFQRDHRHTLQLDVQGGFIDRNVHLQDEFRAGGRHPYFYGPGAIQPNTQFAGYPGYSLLGETMLMASAAYRLPIVTGLDKRLGGMVFVKDVYFQFGGSAGNLWSFRPPEESETGKYYYDDQGERVAYDPADVRREIPFVDKAYKNGNFLLTDVTAELRVSSVFLGRGWDSFFRVAWGFQEIGGIFDVDGDSINDASDTGFGNSLSNETEKPGPRFYLGLGTGW